MCCQCYTSLKLVKMFNLSKLLPILLYLNSNALNVDAEIVVGNLLVGRENSLVASSTCGLESPERFCIPSESGGRTKCFQCDSRLGTLNKQSNHHVSNVLKKTIPGTKQTSWWQSKNGDEKVQLQLNLESQFQIVDLNMTFKEPIPATMTVDISDNFGRTWQAVGFFAEDCSTKFPPGCQPISTQLSYKIATVATNLRLSFAGFRENESVETQYYAVSEMVVGGTCHCNGRSNECIQSDGVEGKVGNGCNCDGNTEGQNCERCKKGFWSLGSPHSPGGFHCVESDCNPIGSSGLDCDPINGH